MTCMARKTFTTCMWFLVHACMHDMHVMATCFSSFKSVLALFRPLGDTSGGGVQEVPLFFVKFLCVSLSVVLCCLHLGMA